MAAVFDGDVPSLDQFFIHPKVFAAVGAQKLTVFAMASRCGQVGFIPLAVVAHCIPRMVGLDGGGVHFFPGKTGVAFYRRGLNACKPAHQLEHKGVAVAAGAAGFQDQLQLLPGIVKRVYRFLRLCIEPILIAAIVGDKFGEPGKNGTTLFQLAVEGVGQGVGDAQQVFFAAEGQGTGVRIDGGEIGRLRSQTDCDQIKKEMNADIPQATHGAFLLQI